VRLFDRLTGAQRSELPDPESVAWLSTTWQGNDTTENVAQQTYLTFSIAAYSANSAVFACAMARMQLVSQAKFKFLDAKTGRLSGGPELQILGEPWPNGTSGDLISSMLQHVDIAGNAFVRRAGGRLVSMRPDWVSIVNAQVVDGYDIDGKPQVHDEVIGYLYSEGGIGVGEAVFYDVADVAHWAPYPDPLARWRGMTWLTPVLREINADISMSQHRQQFFDQAGTPNMVLKYQQKLSPDTVNTIRDRWRARYSGPSSAGSTVVLDDGADLTVVGNSFEQMRFTDLQKMGEARIASAAGVPPIVAGLGAGLDASTYSNYGQALRSFANGTMQHLWTSAAAALAKLVDVPPGARLCFDTGNIPALQDAETDRATAAHIYSQAASVLITSGFEPESVQNALVAGDMSLLAHSGMVSVQLQSPGAVPAQPPAPRFDAHMHIEDGAFRPVVEVQPAAAPVVRNYYDIDVDGTTALTEGAVVVNAPVTVPERSVEVTVPPAPEPGPVRKRIETDDAGRITAVIEERA